LDAVAGLKNLAKAPEARKQAILADRHRHLEDRYRRRQDGQKLTAKLEELNPRRRSTSR